METEDPLLDFLDVIAFIRDDSDFSAEEMIARLRCFFRNQHNPVRHPLGGFRCLECGHVGADLEEMGYVDGGYVMPVRRVFSRTRGEFTRTMSWEPSGRGW